MAKVVMEWDHRRVLAEVSGRLVRGMDRACSFVAGVAEARAPVRTGRLKGGITYEVVSVKEVVEGRVGQKRKGAFYEYFVELGTSKMPAKPHLRPAVIENAETIVRLIEEG